MLNFLVSFCVLSSFLLPSSVLNFLGLPGGGTGAELFDKIPVPTIIVFCSFALFFLVRGKQKDRGTTTVFYLNILVGLWWGVYGYAVHRQPLTVPMVSYVAPFMLAVMLLHVDAEKHRSLGRFVHFFVIGNAFLALIEYGLQGRLVPLPAGFSGGYDGRAAALMGHPLTGAAVTGGYILAILSNLRSYKKIIWPAMGIGLCLLAMAAYGGRAALVSLLFCGSLVLWDGEWSKTESGRRDMRRILAFCAVLSFLSMVLFVGHVNGLFDTVMERFREDHGSGHTRTVALNAVMDSSLSTFLFGRPDKFIQYWDAEFNRVAMVTPESFWLNLQFYGGLIVSLPVAVLFFAAGRRLCRVVSGHAVYVLLHFLICISGSTGLGGKNQLLVMFLVMVFGLCRNVVLSKPPRVAERALLEAQGVRVDKTGMGVE